MGWKVRQGRSKSQDGGIAVAGFGGGAYRWMSRLVYQTKRYPDQGYLVWL
jgi:hypothetical protein